MIPKDTRGEIPIYSLQVIANEERILPEIPVALMKPTPKLLTEVGYNSGK